MKHFITLIGISIFFFWSLNYSFAQPEYGCHFSHNQVRIKTPTPAQFKAYRASVERSDTFDVLNYDIYLDVTEFNNRNLKASCEVLFKARKDNANYFTLDLEQMNIDSITSVDGPLNFSRSGFFVHIQLPSALNENDEYAVRLYYHGRPDVSDGGFGGFYFENGYAYNLGIDLIGMPHNFGRSWFPCFDNFVERATYDFTVMTDAGRKGYCTGTFLGEQNIGLDTVIRSYRMDQLLPTYLVGVAVSTYAEQNFTHSGAYGDIPVQLVARQSDLEDMQESLAFLTDAIDALEYWYGPYQWDRVGYVITTRGAMEHSTSIAYPSNSILGGELSTRLMSHELCHHWWGNYITVNYAPDMWIKEGNAEYGAHLTDEFIGGKEALRETVRNNHYFVMSTAHIVDGKRLALSPLAQEDTYGRHTYYRGASMIHNLRAYLGDSLFRSSMQQVLQDNAYSFLNAQTYRDALTVASGKDMTDFFDDWIFSPGYSDFYIDAVYYDDSESNNKVKIRQGQYFSNNLHTNVPLQLTFMNEEGQTSLFEATASGAASEITIPDSLINYPYVAINSGHHLNMGMFEEQIDVKEAGIYKDNYTNFLLNATQVHDSFSVFVEHHLVSPFGDYDADQFRISENHFWHITGNMEDKYDGTFILYYNAKEGLALDADLTLISEDSLVLLYRPDGTIPWQEYDDYTQVKISPVDGKGNIILQNLLPGDYVFANRLVGSSNTIRLNEFSERIRCHPNPAHDYLNLEFDDLTRSTELKIMDLTGSIRMIAPLEKDQKFMRIPTNDLAKGTFLLVLEDEFGKAIACSKVIVQ
jgi:aminopeptidase N